MTRRHPVQFFIDKATVGERTGLAQGHGTNYQQTRDTTKSPDPRARPAPQHRIPGRWGWPEGTRYAKLRLGSAPSPWSGAAWNPVSLVPQGRVPPRVLGWGPSPSRGGSQEGRPEQVLAHLTSHLQLTALCTATCSKPGPQSPTEGHHPRGDPQLRQFSSDSHALCQTLRITKKPAAPLGPVTVPSGRRLEQGHFTRLLPRVGRGRDQKMCGGALSPHPHPLPSPWGRARMARGGCRPQNPGCKCGPGCWASR